MTYLQLRQVQPRQASVEWLQGLQAKTKELSSPVQGRKEVAVPWVPFPMQKRDGLCLFHLQKGRGRAVSDLGGGPFRPHLAEWPGLSRSRPVHASMLPAYSSKSVTCSLLNYFTPSLLTTSLLTTSLLTTSLLTTSLLTTSLLTAYCVPLTTDYLLELQALLRLLLRKFFAAGAFLFQLALGSHSCQLGAGVCGIRSSLVVRIGWGGMWRLEVGWGLA